MNDLKKTTNTLSQWLRNSITIKLLSIFILVLLLLIPTAMVESIISEREYLQKQATREVSSKWSNEQYLSGPILSVPVFFEKEEKDKVVRYVQFAHFLPEVLNLSGDIFPEQLRRGIYEVVVYKSDLKVEGQFFVNDDIDASGYRSIGWNEAFLTFGISDLRGIEESISVNWNGTELPVEPGSKIQSIISSGVTVKLPAIPSQEKGALTFDFDLKLQGSSNMSFFPLGKETKVNIQSNWPAPSFDGAFLPDERTVSSDGFSANWKVLQLNRNFPQHWMDDQFGKDIDRSRFGVNLLLPLDDYQKTMRSAKYAIMTIALTFLVFFLVEVLTKRRIHPFQYSLVGLALSLFYVLLLAISEHINFNQAYLYASVAIVLLVGLYSLSVFRSLKFAIILVLVMSSVYVFLFVILQMADYALLIGSIGLLVILALTMYFTRNIDWYNNAKPEQALK